MTTSVNEVPSVEPDRRLAFAIANPPLIPAFVAIEGTLRNDGAEADYIGDFGINGGAGVGLREATRTTYAEGVVRCNRSSVAVSRR